MCTTTSTTAQRLYDCQEAAGAALDYLWQEDFDVEVAVERVADLAFASLHALATASDCSLVDAAQALLDQVQAGVR